jgi:hypothetical protein
MPKPNDSAPPFDSSFPRDWEATVVEGRPLIAPASAASRRHFVYPREVEEIERGALELLVRPARGREFRATFALGFADPAVPTGIWTCPDPGWLCAVAGGYAYLVNTTDPGEWKQVEYRPVLAVTPIPSRQLLLFSGHHALVAYGPDGKAWETLRLSWEGFLIAEVRETSLTGVGWDLVSDKEYVFEVDLATGEHARLE